MAKRDVQRLNKIPILYYEDEGEEGGNPIPYIPMEKEDKWPIALFVQEYRETGEFEPDNEGNPQPICDVFMHKYIDMGHLEQVLDQELVDKIRVALGIDPLAVAKAKGKEILNRVNEAVIAKTGSSPLVMEEADATTSKKTIH